MDVNSAIGYVKIDKEDVELKRKFIKWFTRCEDLCLSRFRWTLPPTCDNRTVERTLFYKGAVLIFQDKTNGRFYSLPFAQASGDNMYDVPIKREAFADTGFRQLCDPSNSVVIYNRYSRMPEVRDIAECALELAEIDASITVNVYAQKTPYILKGSKRRETTLKAIYKKIIKNSPVLYLDNEMGTEDISVLNTEAPERYLTMRELLERKWFETLNMMGISTANSWKKERLVGAEAEAADDLAEASRISRWMPRQDALEELLYKFPTFPWDVRYMYERDGGIYTKSESEGQNEPIHNGNL